jgi:hypothetical protein
MADYCSTSDIKADMPDSGLASSTDTTYDTAIGGMITAASRLIDKEVGREANWFSTTDEETRYFDGSGEVTQEIDEIHTLTSVSVSESGLIGSSNYTAWTLDTDYYVSPYNYDLIGKPIDRLIADWNGTKYKFPKYRKAVQVVGQFGYSATPPEDVKMACKIQTMRWFGRAKQMYQDAGGSSVTGQLVYSRITKDLDPDVKILLESYTIGNMV